MELEQGLSRIADAIPEKAVLSKPSKGCEFKKLVIERKNTGYQIAKYTEKQVFHENIRTEELCDRCLELMKGQFGQVNAWSADAEHILLLSKKGTCTYKRKQLHNQMSEGFAPLDEKPASKEHNRKKNYILEEGKTIAPLVDMGVFTRDGKVVNSMQDKYRQINRFLEIIDDELKDLPSEELHIIDFGCGKSYLTFVVYYYLTEIRKMKVQMIGLDLKADVIAACNRTAEKYHYDGLKFELGDINGFHAPFDVDMVLTLHACDTATDYALYNAIQWKARYIFSVPCCQHELNGQMKPENLAILSRYGIIKERFAALATDAIRANLLEYAGYRTQLLEFIDLEHTPKNILIRAVKRPMTPKGTAQKALREVENIRREFEFHPILCELMKLDG